MSAIAHPCEVDITAPFLSIFFHPSDGYEKRVFFPLPTWPPSPALQYHSVFIQDALQNAVLGRYHPQLRGKEEKEGGKLQVIPGLEKGLVKALRYCPSIKLSSLNRGGGNTSLHKEGLNCMKQDAGPDGPLVWSSRLFWCSYLLSVLQLQVWLNCLKMDLATSMVMLIYLNEVLFG